MRSSHCEAARSVPPQERRNGRLHGGAARRSSIRPDSPTSLSAARPSHAAAPERGSLPVPACRSGRQPTRATLAGDRDPTHSASGHGLAYRPRSPADGVLHRIVREHLESFMLEVSARADGHGLPSFVERELREFITCGAFARGFARFRCAECTFEHPRRLLVQGTRLLSELHRSPRQRARRRPGRSRARRPARPPVGAHRPAPAATSWHSITRSAVPSSPLRCAP